MSPLIFIIVLEALSTKFMKRLPYERLYADDLVLIAESEEVLVEKIERWRKGLEAGGLRVNFGKTKITTCEIDAGQVKRSGKYSCGVCKKEGGRNSILCSKCKNWIHKRCRGDEGEIETRSTLHVPSLCRSKSTREKGRE